VRPISIRKNKGKALSPKLPRIQIRHELSEAEKTGAIDTFFVLVKEELDYIPAKVQVIEHLQEKAVFVDDQGKRQIVAAAREPHPLGKAIATPNLLAYLIASKYADGLPLYRLETILKRYGGEISRTTMANWLIRLSQQLQPIVNLMTDHLLQADYIQGDETRIKVLKELGLAPSSDKYMWVMRGGPPDRTVILFNYDRSRGKDVPEKMLEGFEGRYFQSDGYSGYDSVCAARGICHLGCWDHARRKFIESVRAAPKRKKGAAPTIAEKAVAKINALYRIERKMDKDELDDEERFEYRQQYALPKLKALKVWLEQNVCKVDKDSTTGKAIRYTLNQWDKLVNYLEHGSLRISNALFVVGRKAWLFADTPAGAKASAIYYTLIETAKANGVEPYEYLHFVISKIATVDTVDGYEALLPWSMK